MEKFILCALSAVSFMFNGVAMDIPIKIFNDTGQVIIVRDFNFKHSIVNIRARKINTGETLGFSIIPIAGEKESFHIVVGGTTIPIVLERITGKGIGPFIEQPDAEFRAIKTLEPANGVNLRIVTKKQLPNKEKVQELMQQRVDLQDLSEQTGFTQEELKRQ